MRRPVEKPKLGDSKQSDHPFWEWQNQGSNLAHVIPKLTPFLTTLLFLLKSNQIVTSQMLAEWNNNVLVGNAALLLPATSRRGLNL